MERQLGQERKYGGEGRDGEEGEETKHDAECGMRESCSQAVSRLTIRDTTPR